MPDIQPEQWGEFLVFRDWFIYWNYNERRIDKDLKVGNYQLWVDCGLIACEYGKFTSLESVPVCHDTIAEIRYQAGALISPEAFIRLCERHEIELPKRTKGYLRNRLTAIGNAPEAYHHSMPKKLYEIAKILFDKRKERAYIDSCK